MVYKLVDNKLVVVKNNNSPVKNKLVVLHYDLGETCDFTNPCNANAVDVYDYNTPRVYVLFANKDKSEDDTPDGLTVLRFLYMVD